MDIVRALLLCFHCIFHAVFQLLAIFSSNASIFTSFFQIRSSNENSWNFVSRLIKLWFLEKLSYFAKIRSFGSEVFLRKKRTSALLHTSTPSGFPSLSPGPWRPIPSTAGARTGSLRRRPAVVSLRSDSKNLSKILQIFGGLVLGCTKTKFCKKIWVRQHFSSSTRFASFCTAAIAKFSQKIGLNNCEFRNFFWKISQINFGKF